MDKLHRAFALGLLALGLLAASGCGSQPTATPQASPTLPAPATLTLAPTPPPPTATSVPLPTVVPTAIPPTPAPTPPATSAPTGSGLAGSSCTNRYAFVADVSVPDGTVIPGAQVFTKTWRIRNTGTCTWGDGYVLAFEKGHAMTAVPSVTVPRTAPGAVAELSVLLTAPTQPGTYQGYWQLKNPLGVAISPSLWVKIVVTGS